MGSCQFFSTGSASAL